MDFSEQGRRRQKGAEMIVMKMCNTGDSSSAPPDGKSVSPGKLQMFGITACGL